MLSVSPCNCPTGRTWVGVLSGAPREPSRQGQRLLVLLIFSRTVCRSYLRDNNGAFTVVATSESSDHGFCSINTQGCLVASQGQGLVTLRYASS